MLSQVSVSRPLLRAIVPEAAGVFVEAQTVAGVCAAYDRYRQRGAPGLARYHGDRIDTPFRAWAEVWSSGWFRACNIEGLLPAATCPVLAIQGADDAYGTNRQVESIVSRAAGPAQPLILADCGQAPHFERTDEVLASLAQFINPYG